MGMSYITRNYNQSFYIIKSSIGLLFADSCSDGSDVNDYIYFNYDHDNIIDMNSVNITI